MLDKETIKKIRGDFPKEAIQVKLGFKDLKTGKKGFLTGFKPQYVFERMNDCFGHDGWDFTVLDHGLEGSDSWVLGELTIFEIVRDKQSVDGPFCRTRMTSKQQFGTGAYNKGTSIGDAMKGAATNALEKCASLLDVGHKAYKGLVPVPEGHEHHDASEENKKESTKADAKKRLSKVCKTAKIEKDSIPTLIETVFKEKREAKTLSPEEINKLSDYVEKNGSPF